jgi:hypothetical protein
MRSVIVRVIAGGYLAYLGYTLVKGYVTGAEGTKLMFMIFGIVFILGGLLILLSAAKLHKEEQLIEETIEEEELEDSFEEAKELVKKEKIADYENEDIVEVVEEEIQAEEAKTKEDKADKAE